MVQCFVFFIAKSLTEWAQHKSSGIFQLFKETCPIGIILICFSFKKVSNTEDIIWLGQGRQALHLNIIMVKCRNCNHKNHAISQNSCNIKVVAMHCISVNTDLYGLTSRQAGMHTNSWSSDHLKIITYSCLKVLSF